jgi:hypothetical protein
MSSPETTTAFDSFALVELFGHQKIVGRVREASLAGGAFLRIDVPEFQGVKGFTRYYGPGAVYSINPVTEEVALDLLQYYHNPPVKEYEYPKLAEKFIDKHVTEEDTD